MEKMPDDKLKLPPKLTTKEFRERLAPQPELAPEQHLKCWELVIEAFGVTGKRTGKGEYEGVIIGKLTEGKDWTAEKIDWKYLAPEGITPTLAVFLKAHLTGDWVIFTRTHVLAIRDGIIYDRDYTSSVKKRVISAYRIRNTKLTKPVTCDCGSDPAVFGHTPRCPQGRTHPSPS
jgi:hypothetical protein